MSNIARFAQIAADAVVQGRFRDGGAEQTYDLLVSLLETLHSEGFRKKYSPSDPITTLIYRSFNRMILVKMSDLQETSDPDKIANFLEHCIHHQKIILSGKNVDMEFISCFCYHLYTYILLPDIRVKDAAVNVSDIKLSNPIFWLTNFSSDLEIAGFTKARKY